MTVNVQTYDSAGNAIMVTVYDPGDETRCGTVGPTGVACQRLPNHPGNHMTSAPANVEWQRTNGG